MDSIKNRHEAPVENEQGGLVSNSPPANVKHDEQGLILPVELNEGEAARKLASGIDSLVVTMDVQWDRQPNDLYGLNFLNMCKAWKEDAKVVGFDAPGWILPEVPNGDDWNFAVKQHGAGGYAYLLDSAEMTWKVGDHYDPGNRPSVVVEMRSEYLWMSGPDEAVKRLRRIVSYAGGEVKALKVSRVDLCCDILMPSREFSIGAFKRGAVTRARKQSPHMESWELQTMQIGRGVILCRAYDKPAEIMQQSHKWWLFAMWGLVPEQVGFREPVPGQDDIRAVKRADCDLKVIRVEFQLRREALSELGIDDFDDLMILQSNLWAYLTGSKTGKGKYENKRAWLRMVDDRTKHHTMQKVRGWWAVVQSGVDGSQQAKPLIRAKKVSTDRSQLQAQLFGLWKSLLAVDGEGDKGLPLSIHACAVKLAEYAEEAGLDGQNLLAEVEKRNAKYRLASEKYSAAMRERVGLDLDRAKSVRRQMATMLRMNQNPIESWVNQEWSGIQINKLQATEEMPQVKPIVTNKELKEEPKQLVLGFLR
ncbi:hypothetical protein [Poriferisphaera sp. WC338]|uniref:hypothetical protein n=1 Tax=Poriferisphaera sp. WC338 TaxID=3425129 RepID=UPI003D81AB66